MHFFSEDPELAFTEHVQTPPPHTHSPVLLCSFWVLHSWDWLAVSRGTRNVTRPPAAHWKHMVQLDVDAARCVCVLGWKPWRLVFQLKEYQPPPSELVPGTAPAGAKQTESVWKEVFVIRSLAVWDLSWSRDVISLFTVKAELLFNVPGLFYVCSLSYLATRVLSRGQTTFTLPASSTAYPTFPTILFNKNQRWLGNSSISQKSNHQLII